MVGYGLDREGVYSGKASIFLSVLKKNIHLYSLTSVSDLLLLMASSCVSLHSKNS